MAVTMRCTMCMATTNTTYARAIKANGRVTYVPVSLPRRSHSNPKHVAVTAPTLGRNSHFRGGHR